jgi:hypothetical protein
MTPIRKAGMEGTSSHWRRTWAISTALAAVATAVAAGCAGRSAGVSDAALAGEPTGRVPADRVYVMEMSGIPAEDTTVTFLAGTARTILLQHGPPDNTVFAEVAFPVGSFPGGADSVSVTLSPRPGVYGLEVSLPRAPGPGATIRFRYPMHIAPPRAAEIRYGTRAKLEAALVVGRVLEGGTIGLLASSRPASDNLQAPLAGAGTYLLIAPR